jgi:methylated-DNA-[protein]-cysteine S-methyltransferase
MKFFSDTFSTSFGVFSVAVNQDGVVIATAFGALEQLRRRYDVEAVPDASACRAIRDQILAYCAGDLRSFTVALAPAGTAFQLRVWAALRAIPFAETRTYGQLAAELNQPLAARAVGRANATNPICLIVPCHRVVGADGSLTGFAFGEDIKRRLIDHERVVAARSQAA